MTPWEGRLDCRFFEILGYRFPELGDRIESVGQLLGVSGFVGEPVPLSEERRAIFDVFPILDDGLHPAKPDAARPAEMADALGATLGIGPERKPTLDRGRGLNRGDGAELHAEAAVGAGIRQNLQGHDRSLRRFTRPASG